MSHPVFKSVYPFTGELLEDYPLMTESQWGAAVNRASAASAGWKNAAFSQRAAVIKNVAVILRRDLEMISSLITREMGKIVSESRGEVEKCAMTAIYYAEHAEEFLEDEKLEAGYAKSFVAYQPLGVVLGIMPWNFPLWQVFRYAMPTLMAGNTTLLKHAPNVCGTALLLEKIFREAGAPPGVFTTLIIDTPEVEKILSSDLVHAVTLTGSERAGSSVASHAGRFIKKSVLELGGSDALIVLPDADMKEAVSVALNSRMLNAGQSCIGAKRFIILKNAMDDFLQEFLDKLNGLSQGDPFDKAIAVGPMARTDLVSTLQRQILESRDKGARLVFGGQVHGCNFKPALMLDVRKGMPAFDEETFGPLATITEAGDEGDAIRLANDSKYGLGGSVWTRDIEKGISIARQMETGAVFINALVKSDPHLPFGGIKKSGYGRELGRQGILEFVNVKTIAAQDPSKKG